MKLSSPEVSVVMSVYNGAKYLRQSIESILRQEGVEFEFIIVNDGSTDESPAILEQYAKKDSRVRLILQENQGLTKALIRGCKEARGEYIARQDAGDISLIGRLLKQIKLFKKNPDAVLVSCGTRFVGPKGEHLYDVVQTKDEATEGLQKLSIDEIKGPSQHGSTMFRRSEYLAVGGYRACFRVAQDLDLWLRLTERGRHVAIPDILYQALITPDSISGSYRKQQIETTKLILKCAKYRRIGIGEEPLLKKAKKFQYFGNYKKGRRNSANTLYFIARCMHQKDPQKARLYYKQAIDEYPFHLKALGRLLLYSIKPL